MSKWVKNNLENVEGNPAAFSEINRDLDKFYKENKTNS